MNIHLIDFLIPIPVMHNLCETIVLKNLSHLLILLNFFHYFSFYQLTIEFYFCQHLFNLLKI